MKRWKENLEETFDYCIILVIMANTQRLPPCGWEDPTHKSESELQRFFEVMGLITVKSTSTFTAF